MAMSTLSSRWSTDDSTPVASDHNTFTCIPSGTGRQEEVSHKKMGGPIVEQVVASSRDVVV